MTWHLPVKTLCLFYSPRLGVHFGHIAFLLGVRTDPSPYCRCNGGLHWTTNSWLARHPSKSCQRCYGSKVSFKLSLSFLNFSISSLHNVKTEVSGNLVCSSSLYAYVVSLRSSYKSTGLQLWCFWSTESGALERDTANFQFTLSHKIIFFFFLDF